MDRSGVTRTGLQHREYGVGCDSGDRDDFAGGLSMVGHDSDGWAYGELQSRSYSQPILASGNFSIVMLQRLGADSVFRIHGSLNKRFPPG